MKRAVKEMTATQCTHTEIKVSTHCHRHRVRTLNLPQVIEEGFLREGENLLLSQKLGKAVILKFSVYRNYLELKFSSLTMVPGAAAFHNLVAC